MKSLTRFWTLGLLLMNKLAARDAIRPLLNIIQLREKVYMHKEAISLSGSTNMTDFWCYSSRGANNFRPLSNFLISLHAIIPNNRKKPEFSKVEISSSQHPGSLKWSKFSMKSTSVQTLPIYHSRIIFIELSREFIRAVFVTKRCILT